ncbi:ribbon-helix-helix domain-containing protein [Chelatococcus asaccharovorans]|uniref:Ribbon-helix-helix protein n=1 Tax=Chelatococcus asaccharovorans TaxID=28210 RepID=A0A2V3U167_9HYPH|nr:ribbon-helix-helix domain-containing protein [Chelatococcus asaccharovorans]PXW55839.1 ribbon-helix-helix protein [Chelatococcus asaccharovorans]CAH1664901.1 Ribbon-helix-helix protein [Chelatococcus asaccharovorans]CAH1682205.1 Ribbon-helix-helix protein [Chelatococcus asaccharovorans]
MMATDQKAAAGRNLVAKRSVVIAGHRTSVSLEEPFWEALKEIAAEQGRPIAEFIAAIDASRAGNNLSSAIRVTILEHYRKRAVN